jgi:hypothetical protein
MKKKFKGYPHIVALQLTKYILGTADPDSSISWNIQGFTERRIDDLRQLPFFLTLNLAMFESIENDRNDYKQSAYYTSDDGEDDYFDFLRSFWTKNSL